MKIQIHGVTMSYFTYSLMCESMAEHMTKGAQQVGGWSDDEHVLHCATVMIEMEIEKCTCDEYRSELFDEYASLETQEFLRCERTTW